MTAECVRCGRPTADGYACSACSGKAGEQLRQLSDMVPAARDVAHGLSRRGGGGASGKPGSRLPIDLSATSKLDAVERELTTWARHVAEERGALTPFAIRDVPEFDPILKTARWLAEHLEWWRHRAEVDEFLRDVQACARVVAGVARGPAAQRYLGPCGAPYLCDGIAIGDQGQPWAECGATESHEAHELRECDGDIYAREGASVGRCRVCGAEVSTDARRAWLDAEVRSRAFRAAEIAAAYGINVNTIRTWAHRIRPDTGEAALRSYYATELGLIAPWTDPSEGEKRERLHYVGDILDLAAEDAARRETERAKRERRAAARETAEMGA